MVSLWKTFVNQNVGHIRVCIVCSSSCGKAAFSAISASLSGLPLFPQAVAEHLAQTIERTAGTH